MNAPVLLAQLLTNGQGAEPRAVKVAKPQAGQAVSLRLDGATRLDLAEIGAESITLVRLGDRLVILFENRATVTLEPFFDAAGQPLADLTVQLGADRLVDGAQFATLFPISTDSSVLPTAGVGGPSSSPYFGGFTIDQLAGSGERLGLLGGSDVAGRTAAGAGAAANTAPVIGTPAAAALDDEGLSEGLPGGLGDAPGQAVTFTGSLDVDFGNQFVGRTLDFTAAQPGLAGLFSNGQPVQILITTLGGQPAIVGHTGNPADPVFSITLDAGPLDGAYTVTLFKPLDHPLAGTEDDLSLEVGFIARDGNGDSATGRFGIRVDDDSPEANGAAGAALDEEGLGGNPGEPADASYAGSDVAGEPLATGPLSLGIQWGADRDVRGAGDPFGRTLAFAMAGGVPVDAAGSPLALTSDGVALVYAVVDLPNGGQQLVAYKGVIASGNEVFTVVLDPTAANGSYAFTLQGNLDHPALPANAENDLLLRFDFVAADADGDAVAGAFTVTVDDDAPEANGAVGAALDEEGLGGNPGEPADASYAGSDLAGEPVATGPLSLGIQWGADRDIRGPGDPFGRTLAFAMAGGVPVDAAGSPLALTSDGVALVYAVVDLPNGGQQLVAYKGVIASGNEVFTVVLDPTAANGSYAFTLQGNLDHPALPANAENDLPLQFDFVAADADGDQIAGAFTVTIDDDAPEANGAAGAALDEEGLGGNPGEPADASYAGSDLAGELLATGPSSLGIQWGADRDIRGAGDTFGRTLAFAMAGGVPVDAAGSPLALTSDGVALVYAVVDLPNGGQQLVAYKGVIAPGNEVFTVVLDPTATNGSYAFTLQGNLDHPALPANAENDLPLQFGFVATDADGDAVAGAFTVTIDDDAPVTGAVARQQVEEAPGAPSLSGIPLGIAWGADDGDAGPADRSLTFAGVPAGNVAFADANGGFTGLTSSGRPVLFTTINGVLVAYTGTAPTDLSRGNIVFTVTLSDAGTGSYSFELRQPLDHRAPLVDQHYIDLAFAYTATDADGDAVTGTFTVRVDAAGTITPAGDGISYAALSSDLFINIGDRPRTVAVFGIAANTAQDGPLVTDRVLGIDRLGDAIVNVTGGSGDDAILGGAEGNTLDGGDDTLYGRAGDDEIHGGRGDDRLEGGGGDDVLLGGRGGDRLIGGGGFDFADGGQGDDLVFGNGGDDLLKGGGGADIIGGGAGDDLIFGEDGDDTLTGNRGDDTISGGRGADIITGAGGDDTISGGDDRDLIAGDNGDDVIAGEDGADVLDGGRGNDVLLGGAGRDVLGYVYGEGLDVMVGGEGAVDVDTALIFGSGGDDGLQIVLAGPEAFTADFAGTAGIEIGAAEIERIRVLGGSGTDDLDIQGSGGSDHIILTSDPAAPAVAGAMVVVAAGVESVRLEGQGGADVIDASGYTATGVTIRGNGGADRIIGSDQGDDVRGGGGDDDIDAGAGVDVVRGDAGDDVIQGRQGDDFLFGGDGSDILRGGNHDDILFGDADQDRLIYRALWDNDTLFGGEAVTTGADVDTAELIGEATDDDLTIDLLGPESFTADFAATPGADVNAFEIERIEIDGDAGADRLLVQGTGNGDTVILTSNPGAAAVAGTTLIAARNLESVRIEGLGGSDVIDASGYTAHGVTLRGNGGGDQIVGTDLADDIGGGIGNDTLQGAAGDDELSGGDGNDVLRGGNGDDTLRGDADADRLIYRAGWDVDTLIGGETVTTGVDADTAELIGTGGDDDLTIDLTGAEAFTADFAATGGTEVTAGEIERTEIDGAAGSDDLTVNGSGVADRIILTSNVSAAAVVGALVVAAQNLEAVQIDGQGGDDAIDASGYTGGATLAGGAGDDTLQGGGGDDVLRGGDGSDRMTYRSGQGHDELFGGEGGVDVDTVGLVGTDGNDRLILVLQGPESVYGEFSADSDMIAVEVERVEADGGAGSDDLQIKGSGGADHIVLTSDMNATAATGAMLIAAQRFESATLRGTAGDDIIDASGYTAHGVEIFGTDGSDRLTGSAGDDTIEGEADADRLIYRSGAGLDRLHGGNVFSTGTDTDTVELIGTDAGDTLTIGPSGPESFQADFDVLAGAEVTADDIERIEAYGGAGTDSLAVKGGGGADRIVLTSDAGAAAIAGTTLIAARDFEGVSLNGVFGADVIDASGYTAHGVTMFGGGDDDELTGSTQNDTIDGEAENDTIDGRAGADQLRGGTGNDVLRGGNGDDTLRGDDGADRLVYRAGWDVDTLIGGEGAVGGADVDTAELIGTGGADALQITVTGLEAFTADFGLAGGTEVTASEIERIEIDGDAGADQLVVTGSGSADRIILTSNANAAAVAGAVVVAAQNLESVRIEGLGAADIIDASGYTAHGVTLRGNGGGDTITGTVRGDEIAGGGGNDEIHAGAGNDLITYAAGDGADLIDGGSETGTSSPDYDTLRISGDASARTFNIARAPVDPDPSNLVPQSGVDARDVVIIYDGPNGSGLRLDEIERVEVVAGSGAVTVKVGDVGGTAIQPTTIVVTGGGAGDTVDLTNFSNGVRVLYDGSGGNTDLARLGGRWVDYAITQQGDTYVFALKSAPDTVILEVTNVENFFFAADNRTIPADQLVNRAPVAGDDSAGPLVEDGPTTTASGDALDNDDDPNSLDTEIVTRVAFGTSPATVDNVTPTGTVVQGTYGFLTIEADGDYTYTLDNARGATQALRHGQQAAEVFTYTMRDNAGLFDTATITVSVTGGNDDPVAGPGMAGGAVLEDRAAELLVNGGFENALAGWSAIEVVVQPFFAHSGRQAVWLFGSGEDAVLTQAVQTSAGEHYTLTFWLIPNGAPIEVRWNDQVVTTISGDFAFDYKPYTFDVVGAAGSSELRFTVDDGSLSMLDDVSVRGSLDPAQQFASGTLSFTDVDLGDSHTATFAARAAGYFGQFSVQPVAQLSNGGTVDWGFSVDRADLQGLAEGQTIQQLYDVTITDGHGSVVQTVTITLQGTNDAPVLGGGGNTFHYVEHQAATVINSQLTLADVDGTTMSRATVSITGNFAAGQDVLGFVDQNGITGSYDAGTGVLTLTGTASKAAYEAALRSVTYGNSSGNASTAPRTISFQTDDGSVEDRLSNVVTTTVTVGPTNDPVTIHQGVPDGATVLASVTGTGVQGNGMSVMPSMSGDGRYVVFYGNASTLAPDANGGGTADVFVKDMWTGTVTLVSKTAGGVQGGAVRDSWDADISANGRYVVFMSAATDGWPGGNINDWKVFRKDLQTGALDLVSSSASGVTADDYSTDPAVSADGRYVLFDSIASNLVAGDDNGTWDFFVKDMQSGAIVRVTEGGHSTGSADISGNGRVVAFQSNATFAAGDAQNGDDIYVRNLDTGVFTLASANAAGQGANASSSAAAISGNGRYIAFETAASNLLPTADNNGVQDIYVKDLLTGKVLLASSTAAGGLANGASYSAAISADGRFVTFLSDASNLVAGDNNGARDVFVKDLLTGEIRLVGPDPNGPTSQPGQAAPFFGNYHPVAISADGSWVGFDSSASTVVGGDANGQTDVFVRPLAKHLAETEGTPAASAVLASNGWFTFADPDTTDTHGVASAFNAGASSPGGPLGTFTAVQALDTTGGGVVSWTYEVDAELVEHLAAGQQRVEAYNVTIDDGHGSTAVTTITLTITGTNDAPVLTAASFALPTIDEDTLNPAATTVAALLGGGMTDADANALSGIAVTGKTAANGTWQYSVDGGASWLGFGNYSDGAALLLSGNDLVRFVPNGVSGGSSSFTYRGWDRTTGVHGAIVDASDTGGSTAFSMEVSTATISVTEVNETPSIVGLGNVTHAANQVGALIDTFTAVDADTASGLTFRVLDGNGDVDPRFVVVPSGATAPGAPGTYELRLAPGERLDYAAENADADPTITRTVEINDHAGAGNISTAVITVTVTPEVNHAPILAAAASGFLTKPSSLDISSLGQALDLDGSFARNADPDVQNATTVPHVSIGATGGDRVDYYKFTVQAGSTGTFDIDRTTGGFDSFIYLYDASGNLLPGTSTDDDNGGDAGSSSSTDSRLSYTFGAAGTYYVAVGRYSNSGNSVPNPVENGDRYELQVSLQNAPVIDPIPLASVNEDAGAPNGPVGTLVSSLVDLTGGGGVNNVTDSDAGAVTGIALIAAGTTNGTWWYSRDNGGSWLAVGAVSSTQALLLDPGARLYFQGNPNFNGVEAISYRAWDQSSGMIGQKVDASAGGGASAFSSAVASSAVQVTAVNDAPVDVVFTGSTSLSASSSGGTTVIGSGTLFTLATVDTDGSAGTTYSFGGNASVTIGGRTFSINQNTGAVTTGNWPYMTAQSVTFTTTRATDAGGEWLSQSVTLHVGLFLAADTFNGAGIGNEQIMYGFAGNDSLTGGGHNDWIRGGNGADTMTGNGGADTFVVRNGEAAVTIGGSGGGGTISGFDVITDFDAAVDKLDMPGTAGAVFDTVSDGTNSSLTIGGQTVKSHAVTNGIISFDDTNSYAAALDLASSSDVAAAVQYLQRNDLGPAGVTVAFTAAIGGVAHTYVYQQVGSSPNTGNDILVDLQGVTLTNLTALFSSGNVDPLVLDLGQPGLAFTSLGGGVQFDINADGVRDQIAWTAGADGILAVDLDGSGTIDGGGEIFSPFFAGGAFDSGLAALASLDSNGDGRIDHADLAFESLLIWQDLSHDGSSQAGELSTLAGAGIAAISLSGAPGQGAVDGQAVLAQGTFIRADGTKGEFAEVGLDVAWGEMAADAFAGQTVLTGSGGADVFAVGADSVGNPLVALGYDLADGDTFDISALLSGDLAPESPLSELARLIGGEGGSVLEVDVDGAGGDAAWTAVAMLPDVIGPVLVEIENQTHQAAAAA